MVSGDTPTKSTTLPAPGAKATAGVITECKFHQGMDGACQVYYLTSGYEVGKPYPFKFIAYGQARADVVDAKTGAVITSIVGAFTPVERDANQMIADDTTTIACRIPRPTSLQGVIPQPGQRVYIKAIVYDGAVMEDLNSHEAAGAVFDPGWGPQPPL